MRFARPSSTARSSWLSDQDARFEAVDGAVAGNATTKDGKPLHMLFVGGVTLAGVPMEGEPTPAPSTTDERAITEVSVVQKNGADMVLKLGPMDEPMDQMRLCMDELLTHWGIDAARQRTLIRHAKPITSPGDWIRSGDYPRGSLNRGESAIVHFRVTVSPEGHVSDCAIQKATTGDALVKTSCDLIRKRARFEPALDAGGEPVASYYVNTVKWVIEAP